MAVKCSLVLRIRISDSSQSIRAIATRSRVKGRENLTVNQTTKWNGTRRGSHLFQCFSILEEGYASTTLTKKIHRCVKHDLEEPHEQRLGASQQDLRHSIS